MGRFSSNKPFVVWMCPKGCHALGGEGGQCKLHPDLDLKAHPVPMGREQLERVLADPTHEKSVAQVDEFQRLIGTVKS